MIETKYQAAFTAFEYECPNILKADAYLASSLLQKAIRRSDGRFAKMAALAMWRLRGANTWRRLVVIAFEDVGIGAPDAVVEVVRLARCQSERDKVGGEAQALLYAVSLLCDAAKDRSTDYLFSVAHKSPGFEDMRQRCGSSTLEGNLALLSDTSAHLAARTIAAWYCSGLDVPKESRLDKGNRPALLSLFVDLGIPSSLVEAVRNAAIITREPFVFSLPLLWLRLREDVADSIVEQCTLPPASAIFGIPSYTFDKHTRAGKAAIGQLATKSAPISHALPMHVAEYRAKDAIRMAAFYVDAAPVLQRLKWSQSSPLELLGRQADMWSAGVGEESIQPLIDLVTEELPVLDSLREKLVRQSFGGTKSVRGKR